MSDGMLTRTRRIDSGEPLLLFDPPGADAFAVSAAACDNPECPCTRMELSVRLGRRRGDLLELHGDPLRFDVSADGTDLRLTGDTPTAFTPAATAWVTEQLGDEQHRAWLRERWRRLRGQSGDPAYPSGIPPEHIDGLVPFSDVFPYDFDLTVVEDRKLYWAVDLYCLEPACKCDEVAVQFLDVSVDGGKSTQVGDGRASVRRLHSPTLRGGEPIRRLWDALRDQHPGAELTDRFNRMRSVARSRAAVPHAGPTPPSAKPGRNTPCPCGSGKKYKRCCGG